MKSIYEDKIWEKKEVTIPLWKWILLHFVKTYTGFDNLGDGVATICYIKKLFGVIYIWKTKTYNKGKLIYENKLKRKECL